MNTYTRNGGWQTSTTGVDISQWQGTTFNTGQVIPVASSDYYYHPYTIEFDTGNDRITQAMIESINRRLLYPEPPVRVVYKEPQPFSDDELNTLLFEEGCDALG